MPLPKISRRDCLLQSCGVAGGLLAGRLPVAQAAGRARLSFAIVSDTHLGYRDGDAAHRRWKTTAARVAQQDVSFVLHLGDVVDGGRVELYADYLAIREQIPCPVHEIPGNHDPADAFAQHLRRPIDAVVEYDWLRCILLNNARRESHDGFFTDAQLDWLSDQLMQAEQDRRLALVCCHVPVHHNLHPDRGWYVKPGSGQRRFYELAAKFRDTLIGTLHGHFHNGIRGWNDHAPLHEICLPSVLYNLNRNLEKQQAPGYNPIEFRPGYTLATLADGHLSLQYCPADEDPSVTVRLPHV